MGCKAIKGALYRLQQKYGGENPVLQIDEAESIMDTQTKTEWIYTVWEWAQENGIRMLHEGDTEKPKRERDHRLMDSTNNMGKKRIINRHIHQYKWLSDVVNEKEDRKGWTIAHLAASCGRVGALHVPTLP